MTAIEEAEQLLRRLSRAEKAQLLQWIAGDVGDAHPGIETRPDVAGGEPCIVHTRITVWTLEQARRLGCSEGDLLKAYPALRAEDLVNAWTYVRSHAQEIDRQILDNEGA